MQLRHNEEGKKGRSVLYRSSRSKNLYQNLDLIRYVD